MNPLLSVCVITYNHEKYIAQAIDSILIQKTNFKFNIVIGEDCSTDRSMQICLEYQKKYPDKIKLLLNEKNIGMKSNFIQTLKACQGKYIAILESDDYWTDPYKLQKQVDFLEAHPSFSLSCHRYRICDENKNKYFPDYAANLFNDQINGIEITLEKFLNTWLTQTLTVVFRNDMFDERICTRYEHFRDVHLFFHLILIGKGYAHNFIGGVYRWHDIGVWGNINPTQKTESNLKIYKEIYYNNQNLNILKKKYANNIRSHIIMLIKFEQEKNILELYSLLREYYKTESLLISRIEIILRMCYHYFKRMVRT